MIKLIVSNVKGNEYHFSGVHHFQLASKGAELIVRNMIRGRYKIHKTGPNGVLVLKTPNGYIINITKKDIECFNEAEIEKSYTYAISSHGY